MRPALALAFNFGSAVGLIMVNKFVFTRIHFEFPITLSLLHFTCTFAALEVLRRCGAFKPRPRAAMTPELWLLSVAKGLGTPLNNIGLRLNSIGVAQLTKLLITVSSDRTLCFHWQFCAHHVLRRDIGGSLCLF